MESLNDIVAEMRRNGDAWCEDKSTNKTECLGLITLQYADRIEAAWKRERVEVRMTASTTILKERVPVAVGNAAALRDAVIKALTLLNVCDWPFGVSLAGVGEVIREIDFALDKPPRQCDVGTAEEQSDRFRAFCNKGKLPQFSESAYCAHECSCRDAADCKFAWAQTPYEAEEGGQS